MISIHRAAYLFMEDDDLAKLVCYIQSATRPELTAGVPAFDLDDLVSIVVNLLDRKWTTLRAVAKLLRIIKLVNHLRDTAEQLDKEPISTWLGKLIENPGGERVTR